MNHTILITATPLLLSEHLPFRAAVERQGMVQWLALRIEKLSQTGHGGIRGRGGKGKGS